MIFSRSAGEKPPVRASSAKRSRIGFVSDRRGMKKTIVAAAQITMIRNRMRLSDQIARSRAASGYGG